MRERIVDPSVYNSIDLSLDALNLSAFVEDVLSVQTKDVLRRARTDLFAVLR